jgi:hypothetical protein
MLYKEFRLAMHPTSIIFLSLSAMMLIPNYPYYMTFFYTTLAIFFTCLSGRENHDIFYSMTLPIRKRDIVKSRFFLVIILQLAQIITAIPFAMIRRTFSLPGNLVGMDANIAFFGLSFLMLGLFNLAFFTAYYKDTDKVGKSFLMGTIVVTLFIIIAEASVQVVPFIKNYLDTKDPEFLAYKAVVLAAGIVLYILLTLFSYHRSVRSFEALDL